MAERIRSKVANISFNTIEAAPYHLTLSIGKAPFPKDARPKKSLISKADWAMYYAKRHGKNQPMRFRVDYKDYR